ncbi:MAG: prepilin peptidase [Bryobacteraceae bacterium]
MDLSIEILFAFLAGLLIGSFLNVCVYRLPRDLSVVRPRSFCPGCEKTIAWYDNVPLLSYATLGARCRHCRARIPLRYPLVELAIAMAFAACVALLGWSLPALKFSIFCAILVTLIATDIETQILPDEFTLGGTAVGLALAAFVPMPPGIFMLFADDFDRRWISLGEAALGAVVASGMIWLVGWIFEKVRHREGMGFGDVKMIAMMGAFLGLESVLAALIIGSLLGSITGVIYSRVRKKDWRTQELPFGAFLGIAALAIAFTQIVSVPR